jgi:hypothetical protein
MPVAFAADSSLGIIETQGTWQTDFHQRSIPWREVVHGGPKKDGIPAIEQPEFVQATKVDWMHSDVSVLVVEISGEARAYGIDVLMQHEIVNDTLADVPIVISYCPLCNTGLVFDRRVNPHSTATTFGVTGFLRGSDMLMYDRASESWWQQATGEAVIGIHLGKRLRQIATQTKP